jgi:hypothetical protein
VKISEILVAREGFLPSIKIEGGLYRLFSNESIEVATEMPKKIRFYGTVRRFAASLSINKRIF